MGSHLLAEGSGSTIPSNSIPQRLDRSYGLNRWSRRRELSDVHPSKESVTSDSRYDSLFTRTAPAAAAAAAATTAKANH